ncbi:SCO2322 family protein [Streptomyces sp.]|uniref:SCO2322 family protein n=1 Tax=Streptomyces sp. TaxID=1931 RepID=UPI002F3F3DD1
MTAGVAAALAAALLAFAAAPAQATGYRYWSYWLRSADAWTYAQSGPALHTPKDGAVEGWRFAVSEDAAAKAARPRGTADFTAICAGTPPAPGRKRIALLIDPGTTADAPGGETPPAVRTACARVPSDASSADALAAVARPLRYDSSGILCAIGGYPRTGCGEQVAGSGGTGSTSAPACADRTDPVPGTAGAGGTASASARACANRTDEASPSDGGGSRGPGPALGLFAGVAVVLALGGAGVWQTRRRRS